MVSRMAWMAWMAGMIIKMRGSLALQRRDPPFPHKELEYFSIVTCSLLQLPRLQSCRVLAGPASVRHRHLLRKADLLTKLTCACFRADNLEARPSSAFSEKRAKIQQASLPSAGPRPSRASGTTGRVFKCM